MNTKQLYKALINNKITRHFFDGIYPKDTLEDIDSRPQLIIVNTSPSTHEGEHWVLFFFEKYNCEFYDPLGQDFHTYGSEFTKFALRYGQKFTFVSKRTQPKNTSLCGIYCLYYAFFRCKGIKMKNIVKSMTSASKVCKIVKKMFTICKYAPCKLLQSCIKF